MTSGMSDKTNNNYIIGFKKTADNQLLRLERKIAETIIAKLLLGDYRVIYRLENPNRLIIVEAIGHRREVYEE
jgi:mRNA-degrading endonuclease RelE of RelBE toxin-antitoxin system